MRGRISTTIALACALAAPALPTHPAQAQEPQQTVWLCRPGLANNPCDVDLATTVIDGTNRSIVAAPHASGTHAVDCFYVYPTVSQESGDNSDLRIEDAERQAAAEQASRFSSVCNVWAPMYRQVTEAAMGSGRASRQAQLTAYYSVLVAWRDYLLHDNDGRPIVFIGHSQGSFMLIDLLRQEIDGDASLRARMISAVLAGGNVYAPTGSDAGGSFAHIPACRSQTQTGCVIAYSTFDTQPSDDAFFGVAHQPGTSILCTNPAALGGGTGTLESYFVSANVPSVKAITTPWIEYQNLFSAACMHRDDATWLHVTRAPSMRGAAPFVGAQSPQWGLHNFDLALPLGNLVDDVAAEEAAYEAGRTAKRNASRYATARPSR